MKKIHNNPKLKESRMPVILNKNERLWLKDINSTQDIKLLKEILEEPLPPGEIYAYPVPGLTGKEGVGNSQKAIKKKEYPELVDFDD